MTGFHGPLAAQSTGTGSEIEETGMREFLGFVVGEECYAFPLSSIREIMRVSSITEVPRGPADVLGIISVRGQVTTLIDLRKCLTMQAPAVSGRARILLVDHGRETLGLLVDRVLQVYRLREDEVELSSVLGGDSSSYVMGIGRPGSGRVTRIEGKVADVNDDLIVLLDPIALLKRYGSA